MKLNQALASKWVQLRLWTKICRWIDSCVRIPIAVARVCVPTLVVFLLNDSPFRRHNRETPDSHFINQYMDQCTCLLVLSGSRRCLIWYARIPSRDFSNSYLCWPLVLSGKVDVLCSFHLCLYPHDVSGCNLLSSTGVSYCLKCRYGRRSCFWFRLFSSDVYDYDQVLSLRDGSSYVNFPTRLRRNGENLCLHAMARKQSFASSSTVSSILRRYKCICI